MNKMQKTAFAVCAGLAVFGMSGCASTQVAGLAHADEAQVPVAGQKVSRALASYGSRGGYRYRRFAAGAATS
jgi:hypothetical protein